MLSLNSTNFLQTWLATHSLERMMNIAFPGRLGHQLLEKEHCCTLLPDRSIAHISSKLYEGKQVLADGADVTGRAECSIV